MKSQICDSGAEPDNKKTSAIDARLAELDKFSRDDAKSVSTKRWGQPYPAKSIGIGDD